MMNKKLSKTKINKFGDGGKLKYSWSTAPANTQPNINRPLSNNEKDLLKLGVQLIDPTGISNYPDVYNDIKNKDYSNLPFDLLGSIPLIGKISKVAKGIKVGRAKVPLKAMIKIVGNASDIGNISDDMQKNNKIPKHKFGDVVKDIGSFAFGAGSGVAGGLTFGLSNMITDPIGQKLMNEDGKITEDEQKLMGLGKFGGNLASKFIAPTPTFEEGGSTNKKAYVNYNNYLKDKQAYDDSTRITIPLTHTEIIDKAPNYLGFQQAYNRLTDLNGEEPQRVNNGNYKYPVIKPTMRNSDTIPTFPNGGITNMQPAELEKEENVLMPNGQGAQFNGATHQAGGIPTLLPADTLVFSDQLKTAGGKTFAAANKPFLSNIKNSSKNIEKYIGQDRKWSENSKKGAQANSTNLFNEQEEMKNNKLMKSIKRAFMKYGGTIPKYGAGNKVGKTVNGNYEFDDSTTSNRDIMNPYGEIGKGLLENSGNLLYLAQEGKNYDTVKSKTLTPNLLDSSEAISNIKGQGSAARYNIYNTGNGNAGNYLSNMTGLTNTINRNISQTQQSYDNQNAGIKNQFTDINENNRLRAEEATAANKGSALSAYYATLGQTGKNIANRWSTTELSNNQAGRDREELDMFKKLYPYLFNNISQ